ncbi:MAG: DNA-binding protein [Thermoplasmata archaeon]|jgi:predicted DNA-binding protein (UPF0251 family)|nr:MAG: DUF134 domain-containing protein [Thermoplasmata archaeon]RLF63953.1 MAG: DNA-binding protein [Thermoplasmata archaeon]
MRERRGRRRCRRWVERLPLISRFEPAEGGNEDPITLFIEEFEALRLVDLVGLSQIEAAVQMGISQKTLWNDLTSARRKIADAIVNGKQIKIEGGSYMVKD